MGVELSVVLVNYNGVSFLENCLRSIEKQLKTISYEIIVVDNNSNDESCEFLGTHFPKVILIQSKENLGFGRGNNVGVEKARGKYILLLNIDTILLFPLDEVLNILKENKEVGVVGIKMLNGQRQYIQGVGKFPNIANLFLMKKAFQFHPDFVSGNFSKKTYEVDWLTGSFLLMPKKVFEKVNGFDEDYFLYVEDVDLCKKIANIGFKRVFLSTITYIHFVGFNKKKNPLLIKGYRTFIKKHYSGIKKYLCLMSLKINEIVKAIKD